MSDFVLNKDLETPIFKPQKKKSRKNIFKKLTLLLIFAFLIFVCIAIIAYYFWFLPSSSVAKIRLEGNNVLSEVFLKDCAGISAPLKWNKIDTMKIARRLARISCIETVSVEKKLPDKVLIVIKERIPVAITFANVNDESVPVLIDQNGVLFTSSEIKINDLPIISGLDFEVFTEGMRLNSELRNLLKDINKLQIESKKLLSQISEIKVVAKEYGGYELLLFPIGTKIKVRIQDNLNTDTIKHTMLILDVVKDLKDFASIIEIDLRSGIAVFEKEGYNE